MSGAAALIESGRGPVAVAPAAGTSRVNPTTIVRKPVAIRPVFVRTAPERLTNPPAHDRGAATPILESAIP